MNEWLGTNIVRAYAGSAIAVLTVIILIVRYCVHQYYFGQQPFAASDIKVFVNAFITGVTVLVVAIPEGLPLAVTLSLAYSVRKV
jgi:Ca2+ transporting ATPase